MDGAHFWIRILLDLGRRGVDFDPTQLDQLPHMIRELWADHADYGDLTIFYVDPQPSDLGGPRTLVLFFLVVVESPEDANPEVRNVLVTQRGPEEAVARPHPYGAKIFTDVTPRDVLVQLDVHTKCRPFQMRDCMIRLGYNVMEPNPAHQVENGWQCNVRFGTRPSIVQKAMNTVLNVDEC